MCRRSPASREERIDRTGSPYYLHRLNGAASANTAPALQPPSGNISRADPDVLHDVYSTLRLRLTLSQQHREKLHRRGLNDAQIDHRGYRTLSVQGRARLARDLHDQFGDALLSVPGFVVGEAEGGRSYLHIAGAAGLLIPARDAQGRIVALKVRRDNPCPEQNPYSYLPSRRYGGPGPGSPVHVPLGIAVSVSVGRLTEVELKADVTFDLSGLPTVGATSAATWRRALEALQALGCTTVRLAFDGDAGENTHVARALADCSQAAAAAGLVVELERWPAAYKGIDDALAAGAVVEVLTGAAALQEIQITVSAATERAAQERQEGAASGQVQRKVDQPAAPLNEVTQPPTGPFCNFRVEVLSQGGKNHHQGR
jgi:hypothetical protein